MESSHGKNLSLLLLSTIFISTSGVLGKYIDLSPEVIILCRAIFAGIFIYIFCRIKKINLKIATKKDGYSFAISGFFMAAHWVTNAYADPAGAPHARRSRGGSIQLKMQRILAIFEGTEEIRNIGMIDGFTRRVFHKILF